MNEIEVIWKFLDNLDEYVYATDIETDELVYMNRKLLEVYGLQSIDDVKGMKCYEVLQKSSVPCGMCNNDRLCAGKFVEWRYYNPVLRSLSTRRKLRKNMVKQQIQGYLFNKSTKYGERRCA